MESHTNRGEKNMRRRRGGGEKGGVGGGVWGP